MFYLKEMVDPREGDKVKLKWSKRYMRPLIGEVIMVQGNHIGVRYEVPKGKYEMAYSRKTFQMPERDLHGNTVWVIKRA